MTNKTTDIAPIRRVVTGHDENGVAKVLTDGPARNVKFPAPGVVSTLMWCSEEAPADIAVGEDVEDMGDRILGTAPPPSGTRFCVMDIPPGNPGVMHRTETLDYVLVLSGELEMLLNDSTVQLAAGDILIQRGTNHGFRNKGASSARVAFVLIDAKPLGTGHAVTGSNSAGSE
jgi:quercetin dioxygenase-like cupin family protein